MPAAVPVPNSPGAAAEPVDTTAAVRMAAADTAAAARTAAVAVREQARAVAEVAEEVAAEVVAVEAAVSAPGPAAGIVVADSQLAAAGNRRTAVDTVPELGADTLPAASPTPRNSDTLSSTAGSHAHTADKSS